MATIKLQIVTSAYGEDKITNVPYINPNVSDSILKTFAEKLAALSSNSYKAAYKIVTTDITNVQGGDI